MTDRVWLLLFPSAFQHSERSVKKTFRLMMLLLLQTNHGFPNWRILDGLVRMVIPHHTGSMMRTLCMGVKRILPKFVASHDQWALCVTNICPFTAYFALHCAKICIQCKPRKFCKPAHLEISFSFLCIILLIIIVTFVQKINRRFRDKLIHLTYRRVVIRITIPKQWTCECNAIMKHKHVVRGIAARSSESTGKSTGCEGQQRKLVIKIEKQRRTKLITFSQKDLYCTLIASI